MNPLLVGLVQGLNQTQNNPDFQNAIPVNPDQAAQALGYQSADAAREAGFNIPNETHYYHEGTGENLTATANGERQPMKDLTAAGETPMNKPTWLHRMFNPESAQNADTINRNWTMQAPQAQQAENIQRSLLGGRIGATPESQWAVPGNKEASISSEQGITPSSALLQQTAGQGINKRLPDTQSEEYLRQAQAGTQEAINAARQASEAGQLGLPERIPFEQSLENTIQTGLMGNRVGNLPLEEQTDTANDVARLRLAETQPLASNPYPSFINPLTKTIEPNTGHQLDPLWKSPLSAIIALQQVQNGGGIPASSGGQWLPKDTTPKDINPLVTSRQSEEAPTVVPPISSISGESNNKNKKPLMTGPLPSGLGYEIGKGTANTAGAIAGETGRQLKGLNDLYQKYVGTPFADEIMQVIQGLEGK